jgi:YbbR domain-containing protein
MNPDRPFLARALLDELPLKVVSMVIAVTLFIIVRSDKDATAGAYVKVVYTLPEDRVLVSEPPAEVRVVVRGPGTRLQRFDDRDLEPIHVDLRSEPGPMLRFDETMVKLPVGLRVASITPPEAKIEFEPRVQKKVPVQPLLEGEPAAGFHVAQVGARPAEITVDGAKSAVEALQRVSTKPLRVVGARGDVRAERPLEPPPAHVRFLDEASVIVEADVKPAIVERVFESLPIKVISLARMDALVEPPAARLILRGPSNLVESVGQDDVNLHVDGQLIDTRAPARYVRTVVVGGLPAGVAAEVQPDSVAVTTRRHHE